MGKYGVAFLEITSAVVGIESSSGFMAVPRKIQVSVSSIDRLQLYFEPTIAGFGIPRWSLRVDVAKWIIKPPECGDRPVIRVNEFRPDEPKTHIRGDVKERENSPRENQDHE
jgi:hypothetical protein